MIEGSGWLHSALTLEFGKGFLFIYLLQLGCYQVAVVLDAVCVGGMVCSIESECVGKGKYF